MTARAAADSVRAAALARRAMAMRAAPAEKAWHAAKEAAYTEMADTLIAEVEAAS